MRTLLRCGANPNAITSQGRLPEDYLEQLFVDDGVTLVSDLDKQTGAKIIALIDEFRARVPLKQSKESGSEGVRTDGGTQR